MDAERVWRYPSASEPGVTRTVRLVNGVLVCDCPARGRCKHIDQAEAEIGFDFTGSEPSTSGTRFEVVLPKLYTSAYWAWKSDMGTPCRITIGAPPDDFPAEYDDGLRWALAPWPPLFRLQGEEFKTAYRQKLDQIGVERIRQAINQVARRHPGQPLTLLCWEPVWGKPDWTCHRRTYAAWWQEKTGEVIEEWPARPRSSTTQPTPTSKGFRAFWSTPAAYQLSLAIPNHPPRRRNDMGFIHDVRLARQARRIVRAATPDQLPATTARSLDQMLTTVEVALSTALWQPEHPIAQACAEALLNHRQALEALFEQAAAVEAQQ